MLEQHVDRPAVEVVDAAQVDLSGVPSAPSRALPRRALRRSRRCCSGRAPRRPSAPTVPSSRRSVLQSQRRRHHAILVCMCTVVPVGGSMVTSCMSARISAMPRPRCRAGASAGFHVPASTTVTCRSVGQAARSETEGPAARRSRCPCSMALASASPAAMSDVLRSARRRPRPGSASRASAVRTRRQLGGVGGERHFERGGLPVQQQRDVVLDSRRWASSRDISWSRQVVESSTRSPRTRSVARAMPSSIELPATLDQTVGVEQQGGARRASSSAASGRTRPSATPAAARARRRAWAWCRRRTPGSAADAPHWSRPARRCRGEHRAEGGGAPRAGQPGRETVQRRRERRSGLDCSSSSARQALRS